MEDNFNDIGMMGHHNARSNGRISKMQTFSSIKLPRAFEEFNTNRYSNNFTIDVKKKDQIISPENISNLKKIIRNNLMSDFNEK